MLTRWSVPVVAAAFLVQTGLPAEAQHGRGGVGRAGMAGVMQAGRGDARFARNADGRIRSGMAFGDGRVSRARRDVFVVPQVNAAYPYYYPSGYDNDYDPWFENNPYLTWRLQREIAQRVQSGEGFGGDSPAFDQGNATRTARSARRELALLQNQAVQNVEDSPAYRDTQSQFQRAQSDYDAAQVRVLDALRSDTQYQSLVDQRGRLQAEIDSMQSTMRTPNPAAMMSIAGRKLDLSTRMTRIEQQAIANDAQATAARTRMAELNDRLATLRYQAVMAAMREQERQSTPSQQPASPGSSAPEQPATPERYALPERPALPERSALPARGATSPDRTRPATRPSPPSDR